MTGEPCKFQRSIPSLSWLLLLVVALTTLFQQSMWVSLDATQARDDDANLFEMALCIEDTLRGTAGDGLTACMPRTPYPPLIPFLAALHFILLGQRDISAAVLSLWPWYLLLVVCLYLGVKAEHGVLAGLAAAALGPVMTTAHFLRASFFTEPALMALAVAAVLCLVRSRWLSHPGWSAALGFILGLGLLVKWTFAFFLAVPVALLIAGSVYRVASFRPLSWLLAMLTALTVGLGGGGVVLGSWRLLVACASIGFATLGVIGAVKVTNPERLSERAGARLIGLTLCLVVLVLVTAPWYLATLDRVRDFVTSNLSNQYAGDVIGWREAWIYYPAVLLTRALGTPLAILLVIGFVRLTVPGRSPFAAWCALAFLVGLVLLTVAPYRTSRYLTAGYGLLVPVAVCLVRRPRWLAIPLYSMILAGGLFHQVSWTMTGQGALWPRTPAAMRMPPRRDLFGNVHRGIVEAREALSKPRWHLNIFALPPVSDHPPTAKLVRCLAQRSGEGVPWFALLWDPAGHANADAIRITGRSVRAPVGYRIHSTRVLATPEALAQDMDRLLPPSWRALPDFPRNFFVITVSSPTEMNAAVLDDLMRFLESIGLTVVFRDQITDRSDYVMRVWQRGGDPQILVLPHRSG